MTAEPGKAVLFGQVFIDSDVETLPSMPASGGVVVAISGAAWRKISEQMGFQRDSLHRAQFGFRREWLRDIAARAAMDDGGRWVLTLDPGSYVLCLANLGGVPPDSAEYPISVHGCFPLVDVLPGKKKVDIHAGELGVYGR